MSRIVDQVPDPKLHIKTLMRIGYTLNSAISDIIDNSLSAECKNIDIVVPPGQQEPLISIVDDGFGMTPEELIQSMKIGSKDPDLERRKGDLGRFGSGMKTASFSQAKRLTVVTKKIGYPLIAARWDVDKVVETNSWCLEVFEENEVSEIDGILLTKESKQGTQILWSNLTCLDRSSHARDHDIEMATYMSDLKKYLALYFHRFMEGKNKVKFHLNNLQIESIDPFMSSSPGYQEGRSEKLRCKGGKIVIKTHVLPHFNRMTTLQLKKMGGADGISQNQGLYIYREKRLINAGGWHGLVKNSQLGALARVQVDIPSALDNEWSTDVKKSSLQLPSRIKRELRKFLSDPVKRSKQVYRYRGKEDKANSLWKIIEDENDGTIMYHFDPNNEELINLISLCDKNLTKKLIQYLKKLSTSLPINHIYEKMSESPRDIDQEAINFELIDSILNKVLQG